MNIQGLQKLTLLDFPGHVACTVFLSGCDFRCPFCHNSELIGAAPTVMDDQELLAFLKKRQGVLEGVAFTGGEPTLQKELPQLMRNIRTLGYPIKLDTNGNHPDALRAILDEGLVEYVAMDIKNSPARYAETIGLPHFDVTNIETSMTLLKESGIDYELRTTVVAEYHDDESFQKIGPWIAGAERYFLQCFTDRDSVLTGGLHAPAEEDIRRWADMVRPFVPAVETRGI